MIRAPAWNVIREIPAPARWEVPRGPRGDSAGAPRDADGTGSHDGVEVLALEDHALPELQIHQEPQPVAMIATTRAVFPGQAPEGRRLEKPPAQSSRAQDQLLYDRPERPPEPPPDGCREAHLPAPEYLAGHEVAHRGPENHLGGEPANLVTPGDRRDMLDELVVQKRHAALDRRRHAH